MRILFWFRKDLPVAGAAGTGTDAQPYFRISNPVMQGEKFDPDGAYVKRWMPELANAPAKLVHRPWDAGLLATGYPPRVVDHEAQRGLALAMYGTIR